MAGSRVLRDLGPTEDQIQRAIVRWADLAPMPEGHWTGCRRIGDLLFHVPNGGRRGKVEAARFKALGVRAGYPDLALDLPCDMVGYNGLRLELKRRGNGLTACQKRWLRRLSSAGYYAAWVNNVDDARRLIEDYVYQRPLPVIEDPCGRWEPP